MRRAGYSYNVSGVRSSELEALVARLRDPALAELLGEADLELDPDGDLIERLGKAVPEDSLIAFGQHGSGSLVALWRRDPGAPLARAPVVWIDSEGDPIESFAPDFAAFLTLLPFGLGQIYDLVRKAQRLRDGDFPGREPEAIEIDIADLREGLAMVASGLDEWDAAGLPPTSDPLAVVEAGVALPFAAWFRGLHDAD